eukprot:9470642-Pyramimonas_sp.AAC.1
MVIGLTSLEIDRWSRARTSGGSRARASRVAVAAFVMLAFSACHLMMGVSESYSVSAESLSMKNLSKSELKR